MEQKLFRVKFRRFVNYREPLYSILFDQSRWSNFYPVAITGLKIVPLSYTDQDLPSMRLVFGDESWEVSPERGFCGILPFKLMEKSFLKSHLHLKPRPLELLDEHRDPIIPDRDPVFWIEIELLLSKRWENDFLGFSTSDRVLLPFSCFSNGSVLECFDGFARVIPSPPSHTNADKYRSISLEDVESAEEISPEFHCLQPTFFFQTL